MTYVDSAGVSHDVGQVKIGQFDMGRDQRRPNIPDSFDELDGEQFFSLGQDSRYYKELQKLGAELREGILRALHDVADDPEQWRRARNQGVTGTSLLRFVSEATVTGQFRRMAHGGVELCPYKFTYVTPKPRGADKASLRFEVTPESQPPSNVHVVIGRNGVGKTRLLDHMARAFLGEEPRTAGQFFIDQEGDEWFANLVSVSFSAFDSIEPLASSNRDYTYVGLKRPAKEGAAQPPKTPGMLAREFSSSMKACLVGERTGRWRRALQLLESDPSFKDAEVSLLADIDLGDEELRVQAQELFNKRLSSGHKIVLLTITRLVESVAERSLVLLDEPEAHLHPPLLSAFTRALSDLLVDRNGVAVVATHSPVILQEVPASCVWILRRSGRVLAGDRPTLETFGENVGVLTREVFGLEVTDSGFHRLLAEAVEEPATSYEDVVGAYGHEIGGEARGLIRALIANRDSTR